MNNDRLGLVMIAATLAVIALIGNWLVGYQVSVHHEKVRVMGTALARALSSADYEQVVPADNASNSLMARLVFVQANQDFAYGAVVDPAGRRVYATGQSRLMVDAQMPQEPFAWFGEQTRNLLGDDRKVLEFHAPLMKSGVLAGFIRVAYFERPEKLWDSSLSSLALMALPVFLLTALFYFLVRRELKPLSQLGARMEEVAQSCNANVHFGIPGGDMGDFIRRFDQFIQLVQSRVQQIDHVAAQTQTASHLLSYRQEKAESVLNALPEAVLVIDDECVPTFANARAEQMLGVTQAAIVGQPVRDWCRSPEVMAFLMRFRNAPASATQNAIQFSPESHPDRQILVSAFPLFSPRDQGTLLGRLVVFRDVTAEQLAKLAGAEFVSHVSHELKTPLNTLTMYSELLLDYAALDESDRVNAVNVIQGEAHRMASLINNLLNISKLDAGTMKLARARVKLHDLLQDVYDSMLPNAVAGNIQLQLKMPPDLGSVRLDKDLFRIAIDNLVSNAIKYSDPGGSVVLSAELLEDNQMQIRVRDEGIGMSPEDCARVFDKYYRSASAEAALRSGHGLGLYLARQIVELHHGTITVDSTVGKGTEFALTFKAQAVNLEEGMA